MKMKKINVTETIVADIKLHIVQNGSGGPVIFWGMYPHQGGEVEHFWEALLELVPEQNFLLVAFQVEDWNRDFSPWEALAVFGTAMAGTRILPQTARYLQRNLKPKMTPLPSNPVRIPKVMPLIVLQSISAYLTATATAVMVSVLAVKCLVVLQMCKFGIAI